MPKELTLYNEYEHLIGELDKNGDKITQMRIIKWAINPNRKFICIFCSEEATITNGFAYCANCKEYKGIMPDC